MPTKMVQIPNVKQQANSTQLVVSKENIVPLLSEQCNIPILLRKSTSHPVELFFPQCSCVG